MFPHVRLERCVVLLEPAPTVTPAPILCHNATVYLVRVVGVQARMESVKRGEFLKEGDTGGAGAARQGHALP